MFIYSCIVFNSDIQVWNSKNNILDVANNSEQQPNSFWHPKFEQLQMLLPATCSIINQLARCIESVSYAFDSIRCILEVSEFYWESKHFKCFEICGDLWYWPATMNNTISIELFNKNLIILIKIFVFVLKFLFNVLIIYLGQKREMKRVHFLFKAPDFVKNLVSYFF